MNKKYTKQRLFSAVFFSGLIVMIYESAYSILSNHLSDVHIFLFFEYAVAIIVFGSLYRNKILPQLNIRSKNVYRVKKTKGGTKTYD